MARIEEGDAPRISMARVPGVSVLLLNLGGKGLYYSCIQSNADGIKCRNAKNF